MTSGSPKALFYLAKDGERTIALTTERDGQLYCYIPNFGEFVYNKPLSVDFQIDRDHHYEPVTPRDAARIIRDGNIGRIEANTSSTLLEWATSEPARLNPADMFHTEDSGVDDDRPRANHRT